MIKMITHIVQILYYKKDYVSVCASVRSILNAFFSAAAGLILIKVGMEVSIDSDFMNPEN